MTRKQSTPPLITRLLPKALKTLYLAGLIAPVVPLASAAFAATPTTTTQQMSEPAGQLTPDSGSPGVADLIRTLRSIQRANDVPVLGLALFDRGRVVAVRTLGPDGDLSTTMPLRWGSITKTVTALTAMAVAQHHRIDLMTPVRALTKQSDSVATQWDNPWQAHSPVRLLHLLELTAGFGDLSREEFDANEPLTLNQALNRGRKHRVVQWPPGL